MRRAVGRSHQRQVVERDGPAGSGGLDERDIAAAGIAKLRQQQPDVRAVLAAAIGQHPTSTGDVLATTSGCEDKDVVGKLGAVPGDDNLAVGVDAGKHAAVPLRIELGRGVLQTDAAQSPCPERLGGGHRTIDEPQLWRQERDLDLVCGERAQRKERLQAGDPGAHNQDARLGHDGPREGVAWPSAPTGIRTGVGARRA